MFAKLLAHGQGYYNQSWKDGEQMPGSDGAVSVVGSECVGTGGPKRGGRYRLATKVPGELHSATEVTVSAQGCVWA